MERSSASTRRRCPTRRASHIAPEADTTKCFIRLTDAAEIPANLAVSRTPFPVINAFLAFSALVVGIGGLPNRTIPRTAA